MKKQRKTISIDIYKQGKNWIQSQVDGYQYQLPYYVVTKQDVRRYFRDKANDLQIYLTIRINWL